MTGGPGNLFRECQLIAHVQKSKQGVVRDRVVEEDRDPAGMAHMIGGIDAGLLCQRAHHQGAVFQVHHVHGALAARFQPVARDVHDQGEPFSADAVAENGGDAVAAERMVAFDAVSVHRGAEQARCLGSGSNFCAHGTGLTCQNWHAPAGAAPSAPPASRNS